MRTPALNFAVPDHAVSSAPGRTAWSTEISARLAPVLKRRSQAAGIRHFDVNDPEQGIVHVIGPELGLTLPGLVITCGDSHTSTHGALGAIAFGIGSTEVAHVLATQTVVQKRPRTMRVVFDGRPGQGVSPKDMILHLIGTIGAGGGDGYALEYAGPAIRAMDIEGRLTVCNMSIECGAKMGMIAPDDRTYEYLAGRPFAPRGAAWEAALAHWRGLPSDEGAAFDREVVVDVAEVAPQVTWGTSPEHVGPVTGRVPDPAEAPDAERREAWAKALGYMGLTPGTPLEGVPVDHVFIGSCTNARLCRTCAPPRRCWPGAGWPRASAPGWCPDRRRSGGRPRPRGSTPASALPASSGASPAARNAWRRTARSCRRASAPSRPPTATSSAARGRARART